jgi:type III restriction enzyme
VVEEFARNIIEIPRITIQPGGMPKSGFEDFDLDTGNLNYQPVSEEILIKKLREQENDMDIIIGKGSHIKDDPDRIIVNELINFPEIDYDSHTDLLFKLARQAIDKFKSYAEEDKILNVVQYHKREIALYIRSQMQAHFFYEPPNFQIPLVFPFTRIEDHNYSKYAKDDIHDFRETVTPTYTVPQKLFGGFKKACHNLYKFDSKTEKDFSILLEHDRAVLKWMRPPDRQFHIYWDHNSKRYFPDFVVETADTIYMVETKMETEIYSDTVQEKARAALEYCKYASDFTAQNSGKPWKYVLIPHTSVMLNMEFERLAKSFKIN